MGLAVPVAVVVAAVAVVVAAIAVEVATIMDVDQKERLALKCFLPKVENEDRIVVVVLYSLTALAPYRRGIAAVVEYSLLAVDDERIFFATADEERVQDQDRYHRHHLLRRHCRHHRNHRHHCHHRLFRSYSLEPLAYF